MRIRQRPITGLAPRMVHSNQFKEHDRSYESLGEAAAAQPQLDPEAARPGGDFIAYETMTDTTTPGFKRAVARGDLLPINPMAHSTPGVPASVYQYRIRRQIAPRYEGTPAVLKFYAQDILDVYTYTASAQLINFNLNPAPLYTDAVASLKTGFMDVLTSAVELRKTITMITGFRRRMIDTVMSAFRAFQKSKQFTNKRRKKFLLYGEIANMFAKFWLEYRFGWRILFYEYKSIQKYVNENQSSYVRKRFYKSKSESQSSEHVVDMAGATFKVSRNATSNLRVGVLGRMNVSLPGTLDPITTAWEVLPLSLVVDMFFNVGAYLKAITPFSGVIFEGSWSSLKSEAQVSLEPVGLPYAGHQDQYLFVLQEGQGVWTSPTSTMKSYTRGPYMGTPVVTPTISLNLPKVVDIVALSTVLGRAIMGLVVKQKPR